MKENIMKGGEEIGDCKSNMAYMYFCHQHVIFHQQAIIGENIVRISALCMARLLKYHISLKYYSMKAAVAKPLTGLRSVSQRESG